MKEYGDETNVTLPDGTTLYYVDHRLCEKVEVWHTSPYTGTYVPREPDEVQFLDSQITFNKFVELCETFSEEELFNFVASITLHKSKTERKHYSSSNTEEFDNY